MNTEIKLKESVARGASYLDNKISNWADSIDIAELDMASTWSCVAGQLMSRHELEPKIRHKLLDFEPEFGFDLYEERDAFGFDLYEEQDKLNLWSTLEKLWIEEIEKRRSK